ncbi:hypothetical protein FRX31_029723 [Thalictrum thalictroides]|uniref:F-box associated beta-propeller type 3 domain-containing protein n=1 Tax=Thalictrum thalictroides TaxID=46969 RepID=A0A7J6V7X7_THATH|nr:hypothetical protein FRX31_029723 [Thalictrum thalictroides]
MSSSAQHFSGDLMSEILVRLPVTSICRFRCVSMGVLKITQEEGFLNRNRKKMPILLDIVNREVLTVFAIDENGLATFQKSFAFDEPQLWDLRHCRGLIAYYSDNFELRVCNVTSEQIVALPAIHSNMKNERFEFGFDLLSQKYKVLVWIEGETSNYCASEFFIRTLDESNRWRRLSFTPRVTLLSRRSLVCSAKGTLFWLISGEKIIISFSLADETFRTIEFPKEVPEELPELPGVIQEVFSYTVFDFEGQLCLVKQKINGHQLVMLKLWILKHIVTSHWELIIENICVPLEGIRLRKMGELNPQYADFSEINGEVMIAASDEDNEYLILFNILSRSFTRLRVCGVDCRLFAIKFHMINNMSLREFGAVVESSVIAGFQRASLRDP